MEIRFRHILFVVIILLCGIKAVGQEISDSLKIHFQQSKSLFNESVAGNSQFYGSLADLLEMAKRKDIEIVSVKIYGAASPEGGIDYNKGLSKRRADRIASYISEIGDGRIFPEVVAVGRDWSGLYALAVDDCELPSREATLDLLCRLAMPNDKESEDRMFAQLKALDGGKPYRYMYNRLFPELRKAGVKVVAVYRVDDLVSDSRALLEATFVEPAMSDWKLSPAAKGAYTVKLNAANVKTKNAVVNLSDMNSPLMLIPQTLTKWSTYSEGTAVSIHEADNAIESYLEISMKLKQNDSYLIGSAAEYKTVYVPFDNATGWEPGKRYIYTLIFGGGYDDHGEPILSPITFDAATVDWADAAGTDVNIK